jgi:CCR4-NOT transcription complex subunit 4
MMFQRKRKSQDPVEPEPVSKEEAKRTTSENQRQQQKLSQVRILQRNTCYVIGISPNIAKEDLMRRFEYFGQYGKIQSITVNKEKAF